MKGSERSQLSLMSSANSVLRQHERIDTCPLCGQNVDHDLLKDRIRSFLVDMEKPARAVDAANRALRGFVGELREAWQHRATLSTRISALGVNLPDLPASPDAYVENMRERGAAIDVDWLANRIKELRKWDLQAVAEAEKTLPRSDPRDGELVNLLRLINDGRTWLQREAELVKAQRAVSLADQVFNAYMSRQSAYFSTILDHISERVATIYSFLHPNEQLQNVGVETWGDKGVELAVDFHGVRHRPPHGVLSESHLNSLGIALFLAMSETFNEKLGFLVLDDVVNSFDGAHRGRLAKLLASEFVDWQLIVLTHDHVFYQQLTRLAPQWRKLEITSWSYEEGPRVLEYEFGTFLEKARKCLQEGDLHGATTKSRRALEELLQEACEGMGALVGFRRGVRNDRRDANELLMGVRRALKRHGVIHEVESLLQEIEADLQATLNVEVHAGTGWASRAEIEASWESNSDA
jgi:hypothetical protein